MVTIRRTHPTRIRCWQVALLLCVLARALIGATTDVPNAALLYYQALIRCPDMDAFPSDVVRGISRGTASAEDVKVYVSRYEEVLETVVAATEIPRCDWGLRILDSVFEGAAVKRARTIQVLFGASARVLAEDGKYTEAFEQIARLRQFAADAAGEPGLSEMLPGELERFALTFWRHTMGIMPPNEALLAWLEDKLTFDAVPPDWLPRLLHSKFEQTFLAAHADSSALTSIRTLIPTMSSPIYRERVEIYADMDEEELIELVRLHYQAYLDDVFEVLKANLFFEEGYQKLNSLSEALQQAALDEPAIIFDLLSNAEFVPEYYRGLFFHQAQLGSLRAAVEIYRARAQTGQLPQRLPGDLPKDPYTGDDFEYEATSEGFILRCPGETHHDPLTFDFRIQDK